VKEVRDDYMWDVYTALEHTCDRVRDLEAMARGEGHEQISVTFQAVGFTSGTMAVDWSPIHKARREQAFPIELIEQGLALECMAAEASMPDDEHRIKNHIQHHSTHLDARLRGVVASVALEKGLSDSDPSRRERFLRVVESGMVSDIHLNLSGSGADREEIWSQVFEALTGDPFKSIHLCSEILTALPEAAAAQWTNLTRLSLKDCTSLTALPEAAAAQWTNLTDLSLGRCHKLTALPEVSAARWTKLTSLDINDCRSLTALPEAAANWSLLTTLTLEEQYVGVKDAPEVQPTSLMALPNGARKWTKLDSKSKSHPLFKQLASSLDEPHQ